MHDLLFRRQKALADNDLRRYAAELGLDAEAFGGDRRSPAVRAGSAATWREGWPVARCAAGRRCSSTASSIAGHTDAQTLLAALAARR